MRTRVLSPIAGDGGAFVRKDARREISGSTEIPTVHLVSLNAFLVFETPGEEGVIEFVRFSCHDFSQLTRPLSPSQHPAYSADNRDFDELLRV